MREYVWQGDTPFAVVADVDTASPKLWFVHADHFDRPIKMTDAARAVVWDAVYRPFGEVHAITGSATNNLRFPGQYFLLQAGLRYNWHRHYDPTTGRYLQPDSLDFVDGPSIYAYARSAPTMYTDAAGHSAVEVGARIGGSVAGAPGAVCGAVIGLAIAALDRYFIKPPSDAKDPKGAKAPGKPSAEEGFVDPPGGERWVKNPNGRGNGWQDAQGDVWVPTGQGGAAHGGPHWDVQTPGRGYVNIYPGGKNR